MEYTTLKTPQEINKLFSEVERKEIYIKIDISTSALRISTEPSTSQNEILYSTHPKVWQKFEILSLIKAFNINCIFVDDKVFFAEAIENLHLKKAYEEELRALDFPYSKKLIYLTRATKSGAFLRLLSKQKYIALAMPDEEKLDLNLYVDECIDRIPVFTSSAEAAAYAKMIKEENVKEYKNLLIKFKDIMHFAEKFNCGIIINPATPNIKGKSFQFDATPEVLKSIIALKQKG